jgi:ABC-2 type transport system ATP-binding protein
MGLGEVRDKMVREYSGGMIRRLEIAESMLHRPPVLFLDEPTVGLDPAAREAGGAYRETSQVRRTAQRLE